MGFALFVELNKQVMAMYHVKNAGKEIRFTIRPDTSEEKLMGYVSIVGKDRPKQVR